MIPILIFYGNYNGGRLMLDGTRISANLNDSRIKIQFDDCGGFLTGSFRINGSIPDLGIVLPTTLLRGIVVEIASMEEERLLLYRLGGRLGCSTTTRDSFPFSG